MIQTKSSLVGHISTKGTLSGSLNNAVVEKYPELEDLEITPTEKEQSFKSKQYGYGNITVKAVQGETLEVTPTLEEQSHSGLYDTVNVKAIETEELNIVPSSTEQVKEGIFNKVTVAGDSDLLPENIVKDKEIFGVVGEMEAKGEENAVIDASIITTNTLTSTTTYVLNKMIVKLPNNFNTSNWTSIYYAFYNCFSLKEIPCVLDLGKVKNTLSAFYNCKELTTVKGFKDLGKAYTQKSNGISSQTLDLSASTLLTHDSLMNVINNLYDLNLTYDVANGGTLYTQKLTLGSTNKAKLTATQIAIATNKGWTVS